MSDIQIQPMLRLNGLIHNISDFVCSIQIQPMLRLNVGDEENWEENTNEFKYNQC